MGTSLTNDEVSFSSPIEQEEQEEIQTDFSSEEDQPATQPLPRRRHVGERIPPESIPSHKEKEDKAINSQKESLTVEATQTLPPRKQVGHQIPTPPPTPKKDEKQKDDEKITFLSGKVPPAKGPSLSGDGEKLLFLKGREDFLQSIQQLAEAEKIRQQMNHKEKKETQSKKTIPTAKKTEGKPAPGSVQDKKTIPTAKKTEGKPAPLTHEEKPIAQIKDTKKESRISTAPTLEKKSEEKPHAQQKTLPEEMPHAQQKTLPEEKPHAQQKTLPEEMPHAQQKTLPEEKPHAQQKTLPEEKPHAQQKTLPEEMPHAQQKTLPEEMPHAQQKTLPEEMPDVQQKTLPEEMPDSMKIPPGEKPQEESLEQILFGDNRDDQEDIEEEEEERPVRKALFKKDPKERRSPKHLRMFLIFCLIAEVMIFIFLLGKFAHKDNQYLMYLEKPQIMASPLAKDDIVLRKWDVVDSITLMSGPHRVGKSTENILREGMCHDDGQMMWFLLEDVVKDEDHLLSYARGVMQGTDFDNFKKQMEGDEILNFFYDLGELEDAFYQNWKQVGVKELQLAPILPWKKRVDFVVVSGFEKYQWGGLPYIMRVNPELPVYCPPLPKKIPDDIAQNINKVKHIIPVLPGYTQMTSRLGFLVTEIPAPEQEGREFELDMVIQLEGGVAIIAGSSKMDPLPLINRVKSITQQEILYYVGGTNLYVSLESHSLYKELEQIKEENPRLQIYPNYNTSPIAHNMLEKVFGENYRFTPLGEKVKLFKARKEYADMIKQKKEGKK